MNLDILAFSNQAVTFIIWLSSFKIPKPFYFIWKNVIYFIFNIWHLEPTDQFQSPTETPDGEKKSLIRIQFGHLLLLLDSSLQLLELRLFAIAYLSPIG